jgi:N-acetylglucosamine repressor
MTYSTSDKNKNKFITLSGKKYSLKKTIIESIYKEGVKSIPELSKIGGVSIPTITRTINDLIAEGIIIEGGFGNSIGGRRPNIYGLNPSSRYVLGIDIRRLHMRMGIVNLHNQFVTEIKIIDEGLESSEDILKALKRNVNELIHSSGIEPEKLLGIGVALPGLIDYRTGISYSYLQSDDKPLFSVFEDLFHYPVYVEHDTRAMALGEQAFSLAKGKNNVLCLNIGWGVSVSMILNGKLYHGHSGFSGEFGHIQVIPDGQLCYCGKIGCLETVASGTTLIKQAIRELNEGKTSLIKEMVNDDLSHITSEIIIKAAKSGDQFAISLLSQMGEYLGKGLAVLIHIFNPELIIIGGELAKAQHYIVDPIQQNLNKYTIARIKKDAQIITSELGENAGLYGTVALVMEKIFSVKE